MSRLLSPAALDDAAARILRASSSGAACAPIRDLIGADDIQAAYAVQQRVVAARVAAGATVVGRKIGLTSEAVQRQLGVGQPDFGVLFDDMAYAGGDTVPRGAVMQPRVEAEIAFVLKSDLVDGDLGAEQIAASIDYAVAALEICGSRIEGWDISLADTVADNASAGAFVLGPQRRRLSAFTPRHVVMRMDINGAEVSRGDGSACLGDPLGAVQWLARTAREFGEPLRAGQTVLSGALGPMVPLAPGDVVRAQIHPLGTVRFTVGDREGAIA